MLKGSELEDGNPLKKMKGRVVFRGNKVWTATCEEAVFEEATCNPADMLAAKTADAWSCMRGHVCQQADASQAYTQAPFVGDTDTYVRIPDNLWPKWWREEYPDLVDPVCRLHKALYGHPDAGGFWERHCHNQLVECGFELIDESRKSCYWSDELQVYLVVYVDDFSGCGTPENLEKAWARISKRIVIGPVENMTHFLGCERRVIEGNGKRGVMYDMRDFWSKAVQAYREMAPRSEDGSLIELGEVSSPYASSGSAGRMAPSRAKVSDTESWTQCLYCGYSGTDDCFLKGGPKQEPIGIKQCNRMLAEKVSFNWNENREAGDLSQAASSVVMRWLYGARVCRYELLFAIQRLACSG